MLYFIEKFNYWKSMKKMKRSIEDNPTKVNVGVSSSRQYLLYSITAKRNRKKKKVAFA